VIAEKMRMILLLDVQRKSIVVAGGMKEAIDITSFGAPNGYFVDMPHEKKKRRHELGNRFFD
jgi:hypothetical protein